MRIERFDKKFYPQLIAWVKTPEALMQFAGPAFQFPLTPEQLDDSLKDTNRYAYRFIDKTNEWVGYGEIYKAETSAYLGRILIGHEANRGKGLGQQMVELLLREVFDRLNFTKAELNVFDWNTIAIRCYEKVGFVINPEKVLERKIAGQTWTAINMVLNRPR